MIATEQPSTDALRALHDSVDRSTAVIRLAYGYVTELRQSCEANAEAAARVQPSVLGDLLVELTRLHTLIESLKHQPCFEIHPQQSAPASVPGKLS